MPLNSPFPWPDPGEPPGIRFSIRWTARQPYARRVGVYDEPADEAQVKAAARDLEDGRAAAERGDHAQAMLCCGAAVVGYFDVDLAAAADAALWFGASALHLGEFAEAESAVTSALTVFSRLSMEQSAADARMALGRVYVAVGREAEAEVEFQRALRFFDDDPHDATMRVRWARATVELADIAVLRGRRDVAREHLRRAMPIFADAQLADDYHDAAIVLADCAVQPAEDPEELLLAARAHFADRGHVAQVADADFTLAVLYSHRCDFARADARFTLAAAGLRATKQFHQLANLQWNRAERYRAERDLADRVAEHSSASGTDDLRQRIVDTAVSALVAADFERFQFVDANRRRGWTRKLKSRTVTTFDEVHRSGDVTMLADLIEWAINGGVHVDEEPETVGPDFDEFDKRPAARRQVDHRQPSPREVASDVAVVMGASTLIDTDDLPMAPPPTLLAENGRVILGAQRDIAASLDPELSEAMETAPSVAAW